MTGTRRPTWWTPKVSPPVNRVPTNAPSNQLRENPVITLNRDVKSKITTLGMASTTTNVRITRLTTRADAACPYVVTNHSLTHPLTISASTNVTITAGTPTAKFPRFWLNQAVNWRPTSVDANVVIHSSIVQPPCPRTR